MLPEFQPMPKIPRFSRDIIITEKIDGTNGTIYIDEEGGVFAASRTRWIDSVHDNHGFAKWVEMNREELLKLGPGWHRGEWWGQGIQRGYGLKEKRFSLFRVDKWSDVLTRPLCCRVVPVLYQGPFEMIEICEQLRKLREFGSLAAPGWMKPEGIVIFHTASGCLFKKTLERDELPKGVRGE